jgi:hypothetical protein
MANTKDIGPLKPRIDFTAGDFDRLVREKGYRVMWQSAELCPCRLNSDTDQPDPSCTICDASGFVYTFPDPAEPTLVDYVNEVPPFESTDTARATQAIVTSMTHSPQVFEKMGEWLSGTAALTTFSFNKVGHRDRFKIIDHTQVYRQVILVPASQIIPIGRANREALRYPVVKLRRVFAVTANNLSVDFTESTEIQPDGSLKVTATPGTRLSISYEMNPLWIVVDYPHIIRGTLIKFKTDKTLGKLEQMPVQAMVRLDYLVSESTVL